jgi:CubicO group peptidase (beta-lactamase class C family)
MAAAGLWTTPSDLAAFVIAIQNALRGRGKPPIDATVAREMTTPASKGFGLGPGVQSAYFSHNGANEGFQGIFIGLDRGGRGVVVMTNSDNGLLLGDEVVHSVATAYAWPVLRPQPKTAIAIAPATMRGIAGEYAADLGGERVTLDVVIGREAGTDVPLVNSPVLGSVPSRLYATTPLRYFTLTGATLDFARGKNGRIATVRIGTIVFTRVR